MLPTRLRASSWGRRPGKAPTSLAKPRLRPAVPVVGGRTRCLPGGWKGARSLTYQWLRGGKAIAGATTARYLVAPADRGRRLACRVIATAAGGAHAAATSKRARARAGLRIGKVTAKSGGSYSVVLRCTPASVAAPDRCGCSSRAISSPGVASPCARRAAS